MGPLLLGLALALPGCDRGADERASQAPALAEASSIVTTDSAQAISPAIQEALDRFRQSPDEAPAALAGEASRDALVADFVRALESADTAAFTRMMISRAEFAWLYYPGSRYVRPPYEMAPDVVWLLLAQNAEKGIGRALAKYGGRPLGFIGYNCGAEPEQVSLNRVWEDCVLDLDTGAGRQSIRLFGSILERDGRFKFMSYANHL